MEFNKISKSVFVVLGNVGKVTFIILGFLLSIIGLYINSQPINYHHLIGKAVMLMGMGVVALATQVKKQEEQDNQPDN